MGVVQYVPFIPIAVYSILKIRHEHLELERDMDALDVMQAFSSDTSTISIMSSSLCRLPVWREKKLPAKICNPRIGKKNFTEINACRHDVEEII
jgi:hypothetical protein